MYCEISALEPSVGQSSRVVGKGVGSLKTVGQDTVCDGLSAQSSPTLHDPMDCGLPGSSVRGICQARVLEWGA